MPKKPTPKAPVLIRLPKGTERKAIDQVEGYHPTTGNKHVLTRYNDNSIEIQRDDYVSLNPATGAEERTPFADRTDTYSQHDHGWLWDAIKSNPTKTPAK